MSFGEVLGSSWKLYRLHWKTIMTIVFVCSFIPFLLLTFAAPGVAYLLGVTETLGAYQNAQLTYKALLKGSFSGDLPDASSSALEAQQAVLSDLQSQLLPYFASMGVLSLVAGLIGLLGMLALLLGFFGKFGSASVLLREARSRYLSFLGTILAWGVVGILGFAILFLGVIILTFLVGAVAPNSSTGALVLGVIGGVILLLLGFYFVLGILFTPYEALARKNAGFSAVRGAWNRVHGKRWLIVGYSVLFSLCVFVCLLPLLILQGIFTFSSLFIGVLIANVLIQLVLMFVLTPFVYLFYGFLYKKL